MGQSIIDVGGALVILLEWICNCVCLRGHVGAASLVGRIFSSLCVARAGGEFGCGQNAGREGYCKTMLLRSIASLQAEGAAGFELGHWVLDWAHVHLFARKVGVVPLNLATAMYLLAWTGGHCPLARSLAQ